MEDKTLTEKESLDLIAKMIQNTQNKLQKGDGLPMLVWGYVTLAVTLAVGCGIYFTGSNDWHNLWFAIPVIGLPFILFFNKKQPKSIRTYIDKVISSIWMIVSAACILFAVATFLSKYPVPILTIELILVGTALAFTGRVVKFNAMFLGGIISLLLAMTLLFVRQSLYYSLAIFAIAFIVNCIIPGHILNCKARKQCDKN